MATGRRELAGCIIAKGYPMAAINSVAPLRNYIANTYCKTIE